MKSLIHISSKVKAWSTRDRPLMSYYVDRQLGTLPFLFRFEMQFYGLLQVFKPY